MRKFFLTLIFFYCLIPTNAQELNCQVQVMSQSIQTSDKQVFQDLQTAIFEFVNNRKWTSYNFKNQERIECSMLINLTEWNFSDEFKATIQVQSRRPIYSTSYNSVLFNFKDNDFQFRYLSQQPLEFSETQNESNLTAVLAFYAYVIIGLDFDSYSLEGGSEFFQKAEAIVNNSQGNAKYTGWKAFESDKNRYWITKSILDPTHKPYRECLYKYHRLGLDILPKEKETGRNAITEAVQLLEKVYKGKPNSFILQLFFQTKTDELVNIFSEGFPEEKAKVVELLKKMDPTNSTKYSNIMKPQ